VVEKIKRLMNGKLVVTYNALFDRRAFHHTDASWGLPKTPWKEIGKWRCAMYATSDLLCVGRLRWWKLSDAARYLELDLSDITLHSSLGDTILAGRVVLALLDFFRGKRSIGVS
jgi:DNA polymerase III epsilon subunit-like protein